MKAKSIEEIRQILKDKKVHAKLAYQSFKISMEKKYNTEWIDGEMNEDEKKTLYRIKEDYNEACELFEDFEKHEW